MIRFKNKTFRKDILQWVLKARGKDSGRPILSLVNVEKGKMICTDGRRLHIAEIQDVSDGLYEVVKAFNGEIILCDVDKAEYGYPFPDFKTVIPEKTNLVEIKIMPHDDIDLLVGLTSARLALTSKTVFVKHNYLKDLFSGPGNLFSMFVCQDNPQFLPLTILFEDEINKKTAVFMANKIEDFINQN